MPDADNPTLKAFLALLHACHEQSLPLVAIRPRGLDAETAFAGGDYDFLVAEPERDRFLRLAHTTFAAAAMPLFIDRRKRDKTVLRAHQPQGGGELIVEVWTTLEVRDPGKKGVDFIWWQDIQHHIERSANGYAMRPQVEALYYLSHLHTKRKQLLNAEVQQRLVHYQRLLQDDAPAASLYRELQQNGDSKQVAAAANRELVRLGILRPRTSLAARGKSAGETLRNHRHKRRMRRLARGNIVAFVGPDGVGKTTIISEYKQRLAGRVKYYRFKKLFRNALPYKLLLPLLRYSAQRHHGTRLEKNQVDDHFGSLLFFIARLRYFTLSLRRLWHTTLLVDRFFHDFLCHGLRFEALPAQMRHSSRWLQWWLPQPRCLVQLDAEYAVIASRKVELSEADVSFYRQAVFDIYLQAPSPFYLYLNTARPLGECRDTLEVCSRHIGLALYDFSQKPILSADSTLDLSAAEKLGSGHERDCYLDPRDSNRCIKASRYHSGDRQQNWVEFHYLQGLNKRGAHLDCLPRCYGWVDTSAGRGLVFDRITDAEGNSAPALQRALQQGLISCSEAQRLLDALYCQLERYAVVFADVSLDNLLLGTDEQGGQRLFIVDGLGARRYGPKLWLRARLKWLARSKLKKQWHSLQRLFHDACPSRGGDDV